VVTLIGSNGAGKSTTLRSISGLTPPSAGAIRFDGDEITLEPAQEIVDPRHRPGARGPARVPADDGPREPRPRAHRRRGPEIAEDLERVYSLFPPAQERERQKAG
jgi:branched-chain amino acid transport system ATP-binding protein